VEWVVFVLLHGPHIINLPALASVPLETDFQSKAKMLPLHDPLYLPLHSSLPLAALAQQKISVTGFVGEERDALKEMASDCCGLLWISLTPLLMRSGCIVR
jgi:hypothetical protein